MSRTSLPLTGILLVAAGFAWWAMRAIAVDSNVYLAMNLIRVVSALAIAAGILFMARGSSPATFRYGTYGFLAAAVIAFVYNVTNAIVLPEDLSTLFGLVGASAAAYGAAHWYEPGGDALAAWWVSLGFALMACNPGMYVLLGFVGGDPWRGGWMVGSFLAMAGAGIFAYSAGGLATTALETRVPSARRDAVPR